MLAAMAPCEAIAPLFWDMANAAAEIYIKAAGKSARSVVGWCFVCCPVCHGFVGVCCSGVCMVYVHLIDDEYNSTTPHRPSSSSSSSPNDNLLENEHISELFLDLNV